MKVLRRIRDAVERWLGLDLPTVEFDDQTTTMKMTFPSPHAVRRRKAIVRALNNQWTLAIATAVAAGAVLKFLGLT